jgi:hypothetical protein
MRHPNSDANVHPEPSARILAIAILPLIFALTITACSTATKTAATNPPEPSKANANISTPDSVATVSNSTSGDLAGTYAVSGAGADGKTYQGEVVVTKRDAVYQMSWKLGAESYDGVAVQSGNTLAATFTTGTDGRGCGAVIYQRNADKSLDGKWGEWGVNAAGAEKGVPAGEPSGGIATFNLTGTNANGSPYTGRLTITDAGNNVYQLAWDTGTKFVGTGVRVGDRLAAGWGARQCGFIIYEVKGGTLEGKWGVPGSTALGTERVTKK